MPSTAALTTVHWTATHAHHPSSHPSALLPITAPCPERIPPPSPCPLQVAQSEEICLELHTKDVPDDTTVGFHVDFVWKSTTFDRMKNSLGTFRDYQASMSGFLFHTILGHNVEQVRGRGGEGACLGGGGGGVLLQLWVGLLLRLWRLREHACMPT